MSQAERVDLGRRVAPRGVSSGGPTLNGTTAVLHRRTAESRGSSVAGSRSKLCTAGKARELAKRMQKHFALIREHIGSTIVFKGEASRYGAYCFVTGWGNDRGRPHRGPDLHDKLEQVRTASGREAVRLMDKLVQELESLQGSVPVYEPPSSTQAAMTPTEQLMSVVEAILVPVRLADSDLCAHVTRTLRDDVLSLAAAWTALKQGHVNLA